MPILRHDDLPIYSVPRIKTRILINDERGAESTSIWEQWLQEGSFIPLHYHDVEETLTILSGSVRLKLEDEICLVGAPATILVPAKTLHALEPAGHAEVHLMAVFPDVSPKIFAPDGRLRPLPWEDTKAKKTP